MMRFSDAASAAQGDSLMVPELDAVTRVLIGLAAAIATGVPERIARWARSALEAAVPSVWVDELLLQTVVLLGYPRALVAAGIWRAVSGLRAPITDAAVQESPDEWQRRGEATCRRIYGGHYERLREHVRALHPALDAWMVQEGYGRVLSRPGLDLGRRELCSVAQLAVIRSPRQLRAHLRGALQVGLDRGHVDQALTVAGQAAGAETLTEAREVWAAIAG